MTGQPLDPEALVARANAAEQRVAELEDNAYISKAYIELEAQVKQEREMGLTAARQMAARMAELTAALEQISGVLGPYDDGYAEEVRAIARAALAGGQKRGPT